MSIRLSLELNIWNTSRVRYEGTIRGSKRIDSCSKSEPEWERVQSNESKYCVRYQNWSLGMWLANYIRNKAQGITSKQGCTGESGFDPMELWVMGPPCGLKSRKGGDILHSHDNKACHDNGAYSGRTLLSWNFSERSSYNATVNQSKIRCIKD